MTRTNKGFKVNSDEARFGEHWDVQHAFVQLTDTGKVLVSYMPAEKMEDFFKTTDSWISPPTKEEINKSFADHDMKVVGLPLKVDWKIIYNYSSKVPESFLQA